MVQADRARTHRPREWRRNVILPARMRSEAGWSDVCILNISSRGMLVHSPRAGPCGSLVELSKGDHLIKGRIVWKDGARAGLRSEHLLAVDDLLILANSQGSSLTTDQRLPTQKFKPRDLDHSRIIGRTIEFCGIVAAGVTLSATAYGLVGEALSKPLTLVERALGDGGQAPAD